MQDSKMLEVKSLSINYGEIQVIKNISVYLNFNESIGLFGIMDMARQLCYEALGLIKPTKGKIIFCNEEITFMSPQQIIDRGIVHILQGNILFPRMTIGEVLKLGPYSKRALQKYNDSLAKVFKIFPWIKERINQKCYSLSGGERQMVAIGVGVMGNSKLLLLDEPTLGFSPMAKKDLLSILFEIKSLNIPLVIVEQDIELLANLTDRLYLVEGGNVKLEIEKNKMLQHEDIINMYFGKHEEKGY